MKRKAIVKKRKNIKVLGVSQGQGALLLPFKRYLIGNIEPRGCFHTPKEEQWKLNFEDVPFVRKKENLKNYRDANVIIGSPNCGASSILSYSRKKTLGKPKEDESIKLFLEVVSEVLPDVFFMENLPKLLDFIPQEEWESLFPQYDLVFHTDSVLNFGNSQKSRVRLVIIGVRRGNSLVSAKNFHKVFQIRKPKKTSEIMKNTRLDSMRSPLNGNVRETGDHKVCMYDYRDKNKAKLNLATIRELWIRDFSEQYKWPANTEKMKTLPGVYRNHSDKYPMTARKQDRQFRPDGFIMSPGELAVIQGFPKRFKIYCELDSNHPKYRYWINKGRVTVTKGPAYEMGLWFKKCLYNTSTNS